MKFKIFPFPLSISIVALLVLFSCNDGEVEPIPIVQLVTTKFMISTSSGVGGSITDSQKVENGQSVKIIAAAKEYYQLKQWTGDCGSFSPDKSEITITASKNCQIGAEFEKIQYNITATSSEGGSVGEGELSREYGQVVSFTAEPEEGYQLSGWTPTEDSECPDLITVKNKVTFTVAGDCSLEAVFTKAPRTITIAENDPVTGIKNGKINITPSPTVDHGDEVVITATANEHYAFKGWSGSCGEFGADESTITITVEADCTIDAVFEKINYTITATSSEGGSVVQGGRQVDEELSITYGQTAALTATPDKGYQFSGWTTENCPTLEDATDVEAKFMVEGNCSLEAVFTKEPRTITIAGNNPVTGTRNGEISITPSENVVYGDEVEITATPNKHYAFKGWSGSCGEFGADESTITITVEDDCTIDAVFEKVNYTITATSSEGGQVRHLGSTSDEELTIAYGQTAILTATPDKGYQFGGWTSENCPTLEDATDVEAKFMVEGNCSLEAVFEKREFTLTISPTEGGSVSDTELRKEYGQEVSLTATPKKGGVFVRWETAENLNSGTETDCPSIADNELSNPQLSFIVVGDCTLKAIFRDEVYNISTSASEGGVIVPVQKVRSGDPVTITATPDKGNEFKNWEGDCGEFHFGEPDQGSQSSIAFTPNGDCHIKAVFEGKEYTIKAKAGNGGSVDTPLLVKKYGERITIEAEVDSGYTFERWNVEGDGCPDNLDATYSIASFKVNGDCILDALFRAIIVENSDTEVHHLEEDQPTKKEEAISNIPALGQTISPQTRTANTAGTSDITELGINLPVTADSDSTGETILYLDDNGVTVKSRSCEPEVIDKYYELNGQKYRLASRRTIIDIISDPMYPFGSSDAINNDLTYVCTTCVTDMSELFAHNRYPTDGYSISSWDVSNVTNMSGMFRNYWFNHDLSNWDVSNVTNMSGMFFNAHGFNQDLTTWDFSNVTDMSGMFEEAVHFNGNLAGWDVSNVTNMSAMFRKASSFAGIGLESWDTSNVTNMSYMFRSASAVRFGIPVDYENPYSNARHPGIEDWDVSNVTNCTDFAKKASKCYMFRARPVRTDNNTSGTATFDILLTSYFRYPAFTCTYSDKRNGQGETIPKNFNCY